MERRHWSIGEALRAPTFAIYSTEGEWIIEGHGVEPDIDVVDDPAQMAKGVDPQLERPLRPALALTLNPFAPDRNSASR